MKFAHLGSLAIFTFSLVTFSILGLFDLTLTNACRTRLYYVNSKSKTCEMGSQLAKSDFEKRSYLLISWGLPESVTQITSEILESDFGIQQLYGGCAPRDEVDCYNETMYKLLQEKYGPEFYSRARDRARRIYTQQNESNL